MQRARERFLLWRVHRFKDNAAFEELYVAFSEKMERFLRHKLPTQEDAEEIGADVFARLWEYAQSTRVESFSGLAFKMARDRCAKFYHVKGRTIAIDSEEADLAPDDRPSPEDTTAQVMDIETIEASLELLKDEHKDAIIMRYLSEMSIGEIAEALEKSENAVRILIHRALKALREKIVL
ncbi:MAG: sigma-70 family RNA polymerase sigma factor [Patescibacteria group bacterium]